MNSSRDQESDSSEDVFFDSMDVSTEEDSSLSPFAALPIEVFLHICSFLEVKDMICSLSRVCKRFHEILSDENIWKSWIARHWNSKYPVIPIQNDYFDWRGACYDIEKEWKLWKSIDETVNYIHVADVHISSVDTVIFINSGNTCISGSKDRSMVIWSPLKSVSKYPQYTQKDVAHDGWIWSLLYNDSTLYSCSWDNTIKAWDLNGDNLVQKQVFKCSSPVLSLTYLDGLLFAGDFAKTVYAFDPRCKPESIFTYVPHQRAVLTLGSTKSEIISGSEDRTLAVWDSRTRCLKQKICLGKTCYPNCSFMDSDTLYVGDNKGSVHVFNTKTGKTKLVASFDMGHQKPISVIKHGRGYLLTGSLDGSIKLSLPTQPPHLVNTIRSNGGEVGGLDYSNGILAIGSANAVEFFLPKEYVQC